MSDRHVSARSHIRREDSGFASRPRSDRHCDVPSSVSHPELTSGPDPRRARPSDRRVLIPLAVSHPELALGPESGRACPSHGHNLHDNPHSHPRSSHAPSAHSIDAPSARPPHPRSSYAESSTHSRGRQGQQPPTGTLSITNAGNAARSSYPNDAYGYRDSHKCFRHDKDEAAKQVLDNAEQEAVERY